MGFDGVVRLKEECVERDRLVGEESFIGILVAELRSKLQKLFGGQDILVDRLIPDAGIRIRARRSQRLIDGEDVARKEVFFILCEAIDCSLIAIADHRVGSAKGCEVFSLQLESPDGESRQTFDLLGEFVTTTGVKKSWLSKRRGSLQGRGLDLTTSAAEFVRSVL